MSLGTAAISLAEVRAVQGGVATDFREDGRTLLQRRPIDITARASLSASSAVSASISSSTAAAAEDSDIAQATYNGSYVEVRASGTVVLAAATPSVAEGCGTSSSSSLDGGKGELHISIDAVPHVLDAYASAVGGRSVSRYRRDYLALLASTMRRVFGATQVLVQEQQGMAEADVVREGEGEEEGEAEAPATTSFAEAESGEATGGGIDSGFPAGALYIGDGFGFRLHVDVHVLQGSGGSLFTAIAYAVHAALRTTQLPAVTLHRAPGDAASVSAEVDRAKPYQRPVDWGRLPLLCVLLLSPTGHYLVDPTLREEWALPQQMHVAANAEGQVLYMSYQQMPSRRGNAYQLGKGGAEVRAARVAPPVSLNLTDGWAVLADAAYVCQAMLHDCETSLRNGTGH